MFRRLIFPALAALLAFQPASAREVFTRTWVENGVKWTETTVVEVEEAGSERLVGLHQPPARKGSETRVPRSPKGARVPGQHSAAEAWNEGQLT